MIIYLDAIFGCKLNGKKIEAYWEKWPGAKKAVDEFCEEIGIQLLREFGKRVFLKKPRTMS